MEPFLVRMTQLGADPGELILVLINIAAAAIVIRRAWGRVRAMCCCTPHGMRLGAALMAAGAMAVMLAAVEGSMPLNWPQTILLAGVAVHCLFDRRGAARLGEPQRAIATAINEAGA